MRFLVFILCLTTYISFAQNDVIANAYFEKGEYEKALIEYKKLYENSPSNITVITQITKTYQQLEQYTEAEAFLNKLMVRIKYAAFLVELGYNFQLKKDSISAQQYYQKALNSIDDRVSNVYAVARSFQNHSLLNEATQAYEKAMQLKPEYNFSLQLAQIYGEQGNIEKMFSSYMGFIEERPNMVHDVKRAINDFISEDNESENNIMLKKMLLKKMQQEPNVLWNELLSWLFIKQKEYNKSFTQEKAIYKRNPESLARIKELAEIAANQKNTEVAKEIYQYIISTSALPEDQLKAHYKLLELETKEAKEKDYKAIKSKYEQILLAKENNLTQNTTASNEVLKLKIAYAHFLAFYIKDTKEATGYLESLLNTTLSKFQIAEVKLELADILVLQEKFNQALIYYTQIQRNLKNSTLSQEARFKVAKTSYYKGDFKWAESQLKILKSSTSQLIANDALNLKLLISDNKYEDSLQTALKLYAKADLLAFQNRNDEAINVLNKILEAHKTEPIIAQTLYKQAQLYEIKNEFDKAKANYEVLIENYRDGILIDDAYFYLALIYENQLNQPEKAKVFYEQIIFNHADSIYFVDARKRFRTLRGDAIN
ncbi:tetratricopeptide repeat protein [Neotamlana laminarinivorans]|uniref:Tetratricopeptide repeat protein n=1 Tax=Neotamlana laminarinivorans TaxID=2883124 RepID=A0A9X1L489_9FLAO|nr:tetratricopeptide repeat protein [Tamlana laminarinivorans]MCB4798071.1 tetratricopeptide repeat protein [Tamlana laminarinivorans]